MTQVTYDERMIEDRDFVRFNIGDTVALKGSRPRGGNFSDVEIAAVIFAESSKELAVAALLETLATEWASQTTFSSNAASHSESRSYGSVSAEFRRRAADWRNRYGDKPDATAATASTSAGRRRDAYSR